MFLIPIEGRVSIASGMTWYQDARRALRIDGGLLLQVLIVASCLALPLMVGVRVSNGASGPRFYGSIFSTWLVVCFGVVVGVVLLDPLVSHFKLVSARRWILTTLLYTALVALLNGGQIYVFFWSFIADSPKLGYLTNPILFWGIGLTLRWAVTSTLIAIYFLLLHRKRQAQAKAQALVREASARDSEIERLRAQINPHFLFNTLTAISNRSTDPSADNIILKLSDVLRYNLSHTGGEASFYEELKAMEDYLQIEQMRFGSNLVVSWEITPAARAALVPQPLLLPLLENAIKYGFETSPGVLKIKIAADVQANEFRAKVENSGRWVEPISPAPRGTQIGLTNLKRRLELYYQGRAKFHQESLPEAVRITLTLPLTSTR
jgi:sensor histidine kinase YesM